MSHPGTYDAGNGGSITYANNAEYTLDNRQYTIMSYFGGYAPGAGWQQDGTSANWLYSSTPMLHDVAAIQAIYGADTTTRTGDTTYGFHSNAGPRRLQFQHQHLADRDDMGCGRQRHDRPVGLFRQPAYRSARRHLFRRRRNGRQCRDRLQRRRSKMRSAAPATTRIIGNDADNTLRGGLGNDTIDGGAGIDSAVFSGLRSAYTVTDLGGKNFRVSGPDGIDTLSNVERLQFDDQIVIWGSAADLTVVLSLAGAVATVTTVNSGGSANASTAGVYLSADTTITTADTALTTVAVPAFGSSTSVNVTLTFPGNLTPGTYYIGALADINGQIAESNESNNVSNVIAVILGNNSANTLGGGGGNDPLFGLGGNDRLNGGAGQDTLTGGTGADIFVFDSTALANATASTAIVDRVTDYDQSGGAFSAPEGDQIDLSGILSAAYNQGNGQPVSSLVRVVASGSGTRLQIDTDGAANGANWVTIAQLDGCRSTTP